ncbi:hypothetical protein PISMIDRAFT_613164 [Pisolithus microcarpus 441]|uniref:Uncharacterized protein n=1 Tax=Pisolithus microcarpus 441 TaxID=765257 RepID=A0A0D0A1J3_9AGAM|nr:hypothetical protein BKA83DRAFT_613164 [Pisolithus microcarpus]KIK28327.1 hypothetical protein PISMIDRAFT_613164 [Pisolithus microcarpus 441]
MSINLQNVRRLTSLGGMYEFVRVQPRKSFSYLLFFSVPFTSFLAFSSLPRQTNGKIATIAARLSNTMVHVT